MEAFCTLFNHKYLSRGLALYESLQAVCSDFVLYIFAFDNICYEKLIACRLAHAVIISLHEFETPELIRCREARSEAEYCWTCTPSSVLYVLKNYPHRRCTYLDADLYFYGSPDILLSELGDSASLITEHRFAPDNTAALERSGRYNVQFMPFTNTEEGLRILRWWEARCLECCSLETSCGDQRYLNDWTTRFTGVHVLQHLGGGVAPWNVFQYTFYEANECVYLRELSTGRTAPVIFYHFHCFKLYQKDVVRLSDYGIPDTAVGTVYKRYIRALDFVNRKYALAAMNVDCNYRYTFESDDLDHLKHEKNYYSYSLFL